MKDPFYAGIMFHIEGKVVAGDQEARSKGIILTDSQVISVLTKVLGAAEGKPAKMPAPSNPREEFLAELCGSLKAAREALFETDDETQNARRPLAIADWALALRSVIESARMRKGSVPGSRDYLDFLGPFIAQGSGG
jgi:hypothetical protein